MPTITFNNDTMIVTRSGAFVLDSFLRQGVAYPHSCRSGQCGRCKSKILSGEIKHEACDSQVLTTEERQAGYFLACRARVLSDLHIEKIDRHTHPDNSGVIVSAERVSDSVTQLLVQPDKDCFYLAGQYVDLKIGELPERPYSMAGNSNAGFLEFHIRKVEGGLVSNFVYEELPVGEGVRFSSPQGIACIDATPQRNVLLVASGTGLAPILSIIRELGQRGFRREMKLYFAARRQRDFYFVDEIEKLDQQFENLSVSLIQQEPSSSVRYGELDAIVAEELGNPFDVTCFLAGSPALVQQVRGALLKQGVDQRNIFSDEFLHRGDVSATEHVPAIEKKGWFGLPLFR